MSADTVPLSQVTSGIDVRWEDPIIWRRNRRRTVTVQANPPDGVPASALLDDVRAEVESIDLPPGYTIEWGGEFEDSNSAQMSLIPGMVPALIIVALVVVALFNAFRPPLIIAVVIPFALIGVTDWAVDHGTAVRISRPARSDELSWHDDQECHRAVGRDRHSESGRQE